MKTLKILITGYKGFIGNHIYNKLKDIPSLDVDGYSKESVLKSKEYDYIIHCAGSTPSNIKSELDYVDNNILLTNKLVFHYPNAKFIFLSTKDIYGAPQVDTITEETSPMNPSLYGITKYASEKIIEQHINNYIILRLPTVVGYNSPDTFITRGVENILHNKPLTLFNANKKFNSLIHVSTIVEIVNKLLHNSAISKNVYNIASNGALTINEIMLMIAKELHQDLPQIIVNSSDTPNSIYSAKKINNIISLPLIEDTLLMYISDLRKLYDR